MAYTTQAKIEAYKGRSLTANEVTVLTELLPAVDTIIDELTGGTFTASSADYYYDGGGTIIDLGAGMTTITEVGYIDDSDAKTAIDAISYLAYPLNKTRKSYIRIKNGTFNEGDRNVYVTGVVGAAPEEIVLASTILASDFLDDKNGNAIEEKIGDYQVKFSDIPQSTRSSINQLLMTYRDIKI